MFVFSSANSISAGAVQTFFSLPELWCSSAVFHVNEAPGALKMMGLSARDTGDILQSRILVLAR